MGRQHRFVATDQGYIAKNIQKMNSNIHFWRASERKIHPTYQIGTSFELFFQFCCSCFALKPWNPVPLNIKHWTLTADWKEVFKRVNKFSKQLWKFFLHKAYQDANMQAFLKKSKVAGDEGIQIPKGYKNFIPILTRVPNTIIMRKGWISLTIALVLICGALASTTPEVIDLTDETLVSTIDSAKDAVWLVELYANLDLS